ncbi:methyltransferase domain-containing protein [Candidatus Shapirobacteria bacterium]|nr:methyltransferase domain-containing protein [Candidatus Shapirobacteria bacterium]
MVAIDRNYQLLRCPYCGGKFKKHRDSLVCDCDEFPIVEGILCLDKSIVKRVIDKQQKNDKVGALAEALGFGKRRVILKLLMWLAEKKIFIYWLWGYKKHEWNYYINRHEERESELFWWPTLIKHQKLEVWVDIGSGFGHNHQKLLKKYPGTTIYSVENSFKNLLLSKLIYDENSRLVRVCADMSEVGSLFIEHKVDVVTLIDVLPFVKNQQKLVEIVVKKILGRNGVVVMTSMVEHVYLETLGNYFPIYWEKLKSWLPKDGVFLDELKVLGEGDALKSVLVDKQKPVFRYSVIWPGKMPQKIVFGAKNYWKDAKIKWKNKVY